MFVICLTCFYILVVSFCCCAVYMLLVHVPNHYRMAWGYLQNKLPQTLLLLSVTSILSQYLFSLKLDDHFIQMMMSIVIGHVVYEEKEIHS